MREGFRSQSLAVLVGLLVVVAGSVSAAAIANGFVGYVGYVGEVLRSGGAADRMS